MVQMLTAGRIDYLVEYPDTGEYIARKIGNDTLVSVIISEKSDLSWSFIACPRTEWGRALMNKINNIVYKLRQTDAYRKAYEKVLNKNLRPVYQQKYNEIFLKQ